MTNPHTPTGQVVRLKMFRRGTFKASKYRNAAPFPQKPDLVIRELSLGSYLSHGNFIAASAGYMAFNWGRGGNSLAVLPIGATGRQNNEVPLIHAGAEFVSDFQFSPFDDGILATGSNDTLVRFRRGKYVVLDGNQLGLSVFLRPKRIRLHLQEKLMSF